MTSEPITYTIRKIQAAMKSLYTCGRCGGRGSLSEYVNYNGGVCFECSGRGCSLPRGKKDRAAYAKMETELAALQAQVEAQNAAARACADELPDPDTLDLSDLLRPETVTTQNIYTGDILDLLDLTANA